jgi:ribosomal protein L7Ae-like RNA K-turn-binding protein
MTTCPRKWRQAVKNSTRFLGIIKKSGRLAVGEETVTSAAETKKARLIITASDAGDYTLRRARHLSETKEIPHITIDETKDDIGLITGRGTVAIAAIMDMGMAAGFIQKLNGESGGYDELEEQLTGKAERFLRRKKMKDEGKSKTGKRRQNI